MRSIVACWAEWYSRCHGTRWAVLVLRALNDLGILRCCSCGAVETLGADIAMELVMQVSTVRERTFRTWELSGRGSTSRTIVTGGTWETQVVCHALVRAMELGRTLV